MKTITIQFDVTTDELRLLEMADLASPSAVRVRSMLLAAAAAHVRRFADDVRTSHAARVTMRREDRDYPISSKVDHKVKARISSEQMDAAVNAGMYKSK